MKALEIDVDKLVVGETNARLPERMGDLTDLTLDIKKNGVIEPLIVRPFGKLWEIIAGSRRWTAAKAAQLEVVPCVVQEVDEVTALTISLKENQARMNLTVEEEGRQYERLMKSLGSVTAVGRRLDEKPGRIRAALDAYHAFLRTGVLSEKKFVKVGGNEAILSYTDAQAVARALEHPFVRRKLSKLTEKERRRIEDGLGKAVLDCPSDRLARLLKEFKRNPTGDLVEALKMIEAEPLPLRVTLYFAPPLSTKVYERAEKLTMAPSDVIRSIVGREFGVQ